MPSKLDYAVGAGHDEPTVLTELTTAIDLREWMHDRIKNYEREGPGFEESTPRGRVYIAETIKYYSDIGLTQTGSAPNFFGGIWSLATCKKGMRGEPERSDKPNPNHPFQNLFGEPDSDGVRQPKYPVFILACSSRNQEHDKPVWSDSYRNWVASIAMVTHGFDRMEEYGYYLRKNHDGATVAKRLTHAQDATEIAVNRGDCHIDEEGKVRYPPSDHQHGDGDVETTCGCDSQPPSRVPGDHIDNSENHVKCVSKPGYWIGWTEPQFALSPENEFTVGYKNINGFNDLVDRIESVGEPG